MGTGGEVANALVCKTSIRGFDPHPVLQKFYKCKKGKALAFPFFTAGHMAEVMGAPPLDSSHSAFGGCRGGYLFPTLAVDVVLSV